MKRSSWMCDMAALECRTFIELLLALPLSQIMIIMIIWLFETLPSPTRFFPGQGHKDVVFINYYTA
jgi:hypothetical protein